MTNPLSVLLIIGSAVVIAGHHEEPRYPRSVNGMSVGWADMLGWYWHGDPADKDERFRVVRNYVGRHAKSDCDAQANEWNKSPEKWNRFECAGADAP